MRILVFIFGCLLLSGCGPVPSKRLDRDYLAAGKCDAGEAYMKSNLYFFQGSDLAYANGKIALCRGEREKAIRYFEYVVRTGGHENRVNAANALIELGVTPPAAEEQKSTTSSSNNAAPQSSRSYPKSPSPPPSVSNVYLKRQESVTGARLCYYSDGSVVRIDGGLTCDLRK